jgi:hypothetical protein
MPAFAAAEAPIKRQVFTGEAQLPYHLGTGKPFSI